MALFDYLSKLFLCLLSLFLIDAKEHSYKTYYMEDFCKHQVKLERSIILSLTKSMFYDHGYRCSVTLKAPMNRLMSIQFTRFDVGQPHMIFCDDSLHVYDGVNDDGDELTPTKGLCGTSLPKSLISSGGDVMIKFKSRYMTVGTGFEAVITILQDDDVISCDKTMFQCGDGLCIDKKLVCDGYYNCLTHRDESSKFANCEGVTALWTDFSVLMRVLLVALIGVSVLTMLGLLLFFTKRREMKLKRQA